MKPEAPSLLRGRISQFPPSVFQRFRISEFPHFPVSPFRVSMFSYFRVSVFQRFSVSMFPCFPRHAVCVLHSLFRRRGKSQKAKADPTLTLSYFHTQVSALRISGFSVSMFACFPCHAVVPKGRRRIPPPMSHPGVIIDRSIIA